MPCQIGGKPPPRCSTSSPASPPQGRWKHSCEETFQAWNTESKFAAQLLDLGRKLVYGRALPGELAALHDLSHLDEVSCSCWRQGLTHGFGRRDGGSRGEVQSEVGVHGSQLPPRGGGSRDRRLAGA